MPGQLPTATATEHFQHRSNIISISFKSQVSRAVKCYFANNRPNEMWSTREWASQVKARTFKVVVAAAAAATAIADKKVDRERERERKAYLLPRAGSVVMGSTCGKSRISKVCSHTRQSSQSVDQDDLLLGLRLAGVQLAVLRMIEDFTVANTADELANLIPGFPIW